MDSSAKQLAREKVRGLWIAMPTPFTEDGELDEAGIERSIQHYVESLGVDGIYCGGVMGEFWALTVEERKRLHQRVAEVTDGRVPLMAHTGHESFKDTVSLTEHAAAAGIDFSIVINPFYPPELPEPQIEHWFTELCSRTQHPIFLFNTIFSGYTMSPELIARLSDLDAVCGVKNPQEREHILEVLRLAGDRLVVTDASEKDWLELHVDYGLQALMSTPALALYQTPESRPIAEYTQLADKGDVDAAWELQVKLAPHRDLFSRWMRKPWVDHRVVPIAQLKAWLGLLGLPQGPVRPPLQELTRDEGMRLREDLAGVGLI
jgi:4-hydroxy-tetrahydrodipicolinate synthase